MRTFTLDTNCLIDIEEHRPQSTAVRVLADAHAASRAHVAVVAMSASEKQQDGSYVHNFGEYPNSATSLI
jgi:hypothetical protein